MRPQIGAGLYPTEAIPLKARIEIVWPGLRDAHCRKGGPAIQMAGRLRRKKPVPRHGWFCETLYVSGQASCRCAIQPSEWLDHPAEPMPQTVLALAHPVSAGVRPLQNLSGAVLFQLEQRSVQVVDLLRADHNRVLRLFFAPQAHGDE
jgi:hypothetical protein